MEKRLNDDFGTDLKEAVFEEGGRLSSQDVANYWDFLTYRTRELLKGELKNKERTEMEIRSAEEG